MKPYFLCPICKSDILLPKCHNCNYQIPVANNVYSFCDDTSINLDGEKQYIGYDNIGEDFEPEVTYWDTNNVERYGVYAACGDLVAKKFGSDIIVLDLGAGLGTASIPLAKNGIYTIAADISSVMLNTISKRANGRFDNLAIVQMNAYDLMFPDNSIDIVVENAMLHLVNNPEAIIKEIVRVLKPGGRFIRYGNFGLPLTPEETEKNTLCNQMVSDISDFYYNYLEQHHYESIGFNVDYTSVLMQYFDVPYTEYDHEFVEIFTEKLKFRLHRMKTGAHSDLQKTSKELLDAAWRCTDDHAKSKYGESYSETKGFSRYGAKIDIYVVRK